MEYTVIIVFLLIICVFLIGIVLVQNSKGGGLISQLGSANNVAGVASTNSFIEKATWVLFGVVVFLCIVSVHFRPNKNGAVSNGVEYQNVEMPAAAAEEAGE